jgi:ribosomal protein S18 acetylase RimI-like enzyme
VGHILPDRFAKLAFYEDVIVGSVCCRVDTDISTNEKKLYIMTLGCLAPYRNLGLGTQMLEHILVEAKKDTELKAIYLHVQISNETAIGFYKKHGFEVKETKKDYYQKISPADAYILQFTLNHE